MKLTSEDLNAAITEMEQYRAALYKLAVDMLKTDVQVSNALMWAADQAWNELHALYAQRRAQEADHD